MDETTDKGVTLKKMLGVLVVELEQLMGTMTNLGEGKGNMPDVMLVVQRPYLPVS